MAIKDFDKKLDILDYLVFNYSKLVRLAVTLQQQGLDASKVIEKENDAMRLIDKLRSEMFRSWSGNAADAMDKLRAINAIAQRKVRELEDAADKAQKVADILGEIDRALNLVSAL